MHRFFRIHAPVQRTTHTQHTADWLGFHNDVREYRRTDEEDDVGVVEVGEEGDLGPEVEELALGDGARVVAEPLDHDVDSLPAAAVDHRPQGLAHGDVPRRQDPPTRVG
jgi:hypothetical protein